jgi:hypothetical protein
VGFILVMMIIAAVSLFAVPLVIIGSSSLLATQHADQELQARYAADAGVEAALWKLKYEDGFVADGTPYTMTFNNLLTAITIAPAPPPVNPDDIPLQPQVGGKALTGYKIVDENLVEPCLTDSCPKTFKYTLFFENYGDDVTKINLEEFGDCLPKDFEFLGVTGVGGFENENWENPIAVHDMVPKGYLGGAFPLGPVGGLEDDNPSQNPKVFLSVIMNDPDPDHPCTGDRWQVKWKLDSPKPEVPKRNLPTFDGRAWIELKVASDGLEPGVYYNEMWWEISPGDILDGISCESSPVYARFPEWDITSSAGGTQVDVRATIQKNLVDQPVAILSWQQDGGGAASSPPPGSLHVGNICGRAVPDVGGDWEAEVAITIHNGDHLPEQGVVISGTWSDYGNGDEITCTTDSTGKCQLASGRLNFNITETIFTVDNRPPPYNATYSHLSSLTINQPPSN